MQGMGGGRFAPPVFPRPLPLARGSNVYRIAKVIFMFSVHSCHLPRLQFSSQQAIYSSTPVVVKIFYCSPFPMTYQNAWNFVSSPLL